MNSMNLTHKKAVFIFAVVVVGLLVVPQAGFAHLVEVLSSVPENGAIVTQSPPRVEAIFNEEMQTDTSTMRVFNAQGEQVDNGDGGVNLEDPGHASMAVSLPPLPEGAYTVRWEVMLLDNDPSIGSFNFFVGDESAATAVNFAPIPQTDLVQDGADDTGLDASTIWMIAGIAVTALIIIVPATIFVRRMG